MKESPNELSKIHDSISSLYEKIQRESEERKKCFESLETKIEEIYGLLLHLNEKFNEKFEKIEKRLCVVEQKFGIEVKKDENENV